MTNDLVPVSANNPFVTHLEKTPHGRDLIKCCTGDRGTQVYSDLVNLYWKTDDTVPDDYKSIEEAYSRLQVIEFLAELSVKLAAYPAAAVRETTKKDENGLARPLFSEKRPDMKAVIDAAAKLHMHVEQVLRPQIKPLVASIVMPDEEQRVRMQRGIAGKRIATIAKESDRLIQALKTTLQQYQEHPYGRTSKDPTVTRMNAVADYLRGGVCPVLAEMNMQFGKQVETVLETARIRPLEKRKKADVPVDAMQAVTEKPTESSNVSHAFLTRKPRVVAELPDPVNVVLTEAVVVPLFGRGNAGQSVSS